MAVHAPPRHQLDSQHASVRMDARLNADMRHKVDDLASHVRRPPAALLRHLMG